MYGRKFLFFLIFVSVSLESIFKFHLPAGLMLNIIKYAPEEIVLFPAK
jgi:hypothetical protein